jgi:hypothetical protein
LPYAQRVALALTKLELLPDEKEQFVFANWCMWHDPRVGFVVCTNLAAAGSPTATKTRIDLLRTAACCLAGLEEYDAAWAFAQSTFANAPELEDESRALLVLADIAQARNDADNEIKCASLYWDAVLKHAQSMDDNQAVEQAAKRYAIALCHGRKMAHLKDFLSTYLEDRRWSGGKKREFLHYLLRSASEVISGQLKWTVRYRNISWPTSVDAGDWPEN